MEQIDGNGARDLPQREIAGIRFGIDATEMVLVDPDNANNRLAARDMENTPEGHCFVLDKVARKIEEFPGRMSSDPDRYQRVFLPRLEALDPVGMQMLVDRGDINAPADHYQTVTILGTDFFFTARSNFQQVDNPWNIIPASGFAKNAGELGFWYNQAEKRAALSNEIPLGNAAPDRDITFVNLVGLLSQLRTEDHRQDRTQGTGRTIGR